MSRSISWNEAVGVRFWVWLFLPAHLIYYLWIGLGIWSISEAFNPDISKKYQAFSMGVLAVFVGLYFLIGAYQVMLRDVRKLFIVYQMAVDNDYVDLKGYYLKRDHFFLSDVDSVKRFRVEGHWWKRIHSVFHRATDHFRLDLKDGRQYCFQGKNKEVENMLRELTGKEIAEELPENWDIQ